jgi:glutathione peroxidase-family protein
LLLAEKDRERPTLAFHDGQTRRPRSRSWYGGLRFPLGDLCKVAGNSGLADSQLPGDLPNAPLDKWTSTKFLIGKSGEIVSRYEPKVKPAEIAPAIEDELKK